MKKFLILITILVVHVMYCFSLFAKDGDTFTNGAFKYVVLSTSKKEVGVSTYMSSSGAVTVPSTVTSGGITYYVVSIESYAFLNAKSLQQVTLPNKIASIKPGAFKGTGLKTIYIPAATTYLGIGVFEQCQNLTTISVDSSNPSYKSVDGVLFDKDVWYLEKYPEAKTGNKYVVPSTVEIIGSQAFNNNRYLEEVIIPKSVTEVDEQAFENAASLKNIVISNSVTLIEDDAFKNCKKLSNLMLGEKVKTISSGAFYGCNALTRIVSLNKVPATISSDAFSGVSLSTPLYVPKGSSPSYKNASTWKEFTNIQEMGTIEMGLIGSNVTVDVGETLMVVRGTVTNGNISIENVEWSSSNTKVAVIENAGVVKGVSAGTSVITWRITDNYGCVHEAQCTVTVVDGNKPVATSLKDFFDKAKNDKDLEVIIDFPLTVAFNDGTYCYVIDSEGTASSVVTFGKYNELDIIPKGWSATFEKHDSWEAIFPVSTSKLPSSVSKGNFTPKEYDLWDIVNVQLNEVVIIKNVEFSTTTPEKDEYYWINGYDMCFKNQLNIPSVRSGKYNIKSVFGMNLSSKFFYPIAYYPAGIGFNYDDCIYVLRSCNDYDASDDSQKLYANFENGEKTYQGFVELGEGSQYFMFMTELNNPSSIYGFTDKWKDYETYVEDGVPVQSFPDGTLSKGTSKAIGWSNFQYNIYGGVYFIVNLFRGSLYVRMGDSNYADVEMVVADDVPSEEIFYNLQGVRVDHPEKGIYIRVKGNVREKILINN